MAWGWVAEWRGMGGFWSVGISEWVVGPEVGARGLSGGPRRAGSREYRWIRGSRGQVLGPCLSDWSAVESWRVLAGFRCAVRVVSLSEIVYGCGL